MTLYGDFTEEEVVQEISHTYSFDSVDRDALIRTMREWNPIQNRGQIITAKLRCYFSSFYGEISMCGGKNPSMGFLLRLGKLDMSDEQIELFEYLGTHIVKRDNSCMIVAEQPYIFGTYCLDSDGGDRLQYLYIMHESGLTKIVLSATWSLEKMALRLLRGRHVNKEKVREFLFRKELEVVQSFSSELGPGLIKLTLGIILDEGRRKLYLGSL